MIIKYNFNTFSINFFKSYTVKFPGEMNVILIEGDWNLNLYGQNSHKQLQDVFEKNLEDSFY